MSGAARQRANGREPGIPARRERANQLASPAIQRVTEESAVAVDQEVEQPQLGRREVYRFATARHVTPRAIDLEVTEHEGGRRRVGVRSRRLWTVKAV